MFAAMGLRIALVVFVLAAAFLGGYRTASNACKAAQADALKEQLKARQVDESFSQGVSAAYEQVASQLRRMSAVNRVELTREVTKEVYRCPLPDDAVRLLNDAIRSANTAAGQPDGAVRTNPPTDGERHGGTGNGIRGPGDDDGRVQQ